MRRRVTRRLIRLQNRYKVLKHHKNDEVMSKNQFTGTATQPQRNRKFCQFNRDQYCNQTGGLLKKVLNNTSTNTNVCVKFRIHQVRSFGSNLAVNIWWRHHLTQDINYKHCTDPCDPDITLNEVDFRGFDDTFMKLQPEEAR